MEDDGIDSDIIPSTVISSKKEAKANRVPSNPNRPPPPKQNKADGNAVGGDASLKNSNNYVNNPFPTKEDPANFSSV